MYEYRARVKRVVDGDTVDFVVDLGFKVHMVIRTRLLGVDTPERGHPAWAKAKDMCQDLLYKSAGIHNPDGFPVETEVIIRTSKTGKYGRWLVEIDGVTDELAKIWPYGEKK